MPVVVQPILDPAVLAPNGALACAAFAQPPDPKKLRRSSAQNRLSLSLLFIYYSLPLKCPDIQATMAAVTLHRRSSSTSRATMRMILHPQIPYPSVILSNTAEAIVFPTHPPLIPMLFILLLIASLLSRRLIFLGHCALHRYLHGFAPKRPQQPTYNGYPPQGHQPSPQPGYGYHQAPPQQQYAYQVWPNALSVTRDAWACAIAYTYDARNSNLILSNMPLHSSSTATTAIRRLSPTTTHALVWYTVDP